MAVILPMLCAVFIGESDTMSIIYTFDRHLLHTYTPTHALLASSTLRVPASHQCCTNAYGPRRSSYLVAHIVSISC